MYFGLPMFLLMSSRASLNSDVLPCWFKFQLQSLIFQFLWLPSCFWRKPEETYCASAKSCRPFTSSLVSELLIPENIPSWAAWENREQTCLYSPTAVSEGTRWNRGLLCRSRSFKIMGYFSDPPLVCWCRHTSLCSRTFTSSKDQHHKCHMEMQNSQ